VYFKDDTGTGGSIVDDSDVSVTDGVYRHLAYRGNQSAETAAALLDGTVVADETSTGTDFPTEVFTPTSFSVATGINDGSPDQEFGGQIDEARFATVERSDAWLATTYANQSDPLAFYSVGGEEEAPIRLAPATESVTATESVLQVSAAAAVTAPSEQVSATQPLLTFTDPTTVRLATENAVFTEIAPKSFVLGPFATRRVSRSGRNQGVVKSCGNDAVLRSQSHNEVERQ
jgi:hypothetical protein